MKLIGLLSWYDEPAWALAELVGSLSRAGADHVVAVDGAFALYPEGRAQSPSEQAQAVLAAAQGAGLGMTMHCPQEVWFGNEVEKRTFLFAAGHLVALPGVDWLWVLDGDEVVTEALGLREALEKTEHDAAQTMSEMTFDGQREGLMPVRRLFRAQASGIHLEDNHFTYRTGDGRLLYEGFCVPRLELVDAEPLGFVRIDHRGGRSRTRHEAWKRYTERRDELGAEAVPA